MKLLRNLLPLLALSLAPALARAATIVPAPDGLAREAERASVALRLEGVWRMDVERTYLLGGARALALAPKLEFRREPLVVELARTASPRMALLPMFDGGLVNDGHSILPYLLVDRGAAFELMVFHPAEGTSFGWADVSTVHLVATADGARLFLGGATPRGARVAYAPVIAPTAPIVVRVTRAPTAEAAELR